jgi:protein-tyrosine-phosphatase
MAKTIKTKTKDIWTYIKKISIIIWKDEVFSKLIAPVVGAILTSIWALVQSIWISMDYKLLIILFLGISIIGLAAIILIQKYLEKHRPKLLIYVSDGGTCRDPMASVITKKLFEEHRSKLNIQIKGVALGDASEKQVSYGAKFAINSLYGEDLLADYECESITADLYRRGDLVLAMERDNVTQLQKNFPTISNTNVYLLKEFFGLSGDVANPWPDGKDAKVLNRYMACANELKETISTNFSMLANALQN